MRLTLDHVWDFLAVMILVAFALWAFGLLPLSASAVSETTHYPRDVCGISPELGVVIPLLYAAWRWKRN